jgi:hypothetical protein
MGRSSDKTRVPVGALWLLAAFVVVWSLIGLRADRAGAALRPLETGVSYVYGNEPIEFEHVKRTGAQLVQTPLRWEVVAPKMQPAHWNPEDPADPNYDWESMDLWVTRAVNAGLTPVLQVFGAPVWADRCPRNTSTDAPCNPDPAALAAFAKAAARRYSGHFQGLPRVRFWQGLDEPNLSLFFDPQFEGGKPVSPTLYRTLINAFYSAVKSVDRSNLVLAAGLGPIAVPHYTIGPMRFARLLLCMTGRQHPHPTRGNCQGGVHFDIFDIHPYTTGGPTHQGGVDDVEMGDLPKLQALLRAADNAGRIHGRFRHTPLWITEMSWDSKPPDPGGLPMSIETQWTAEALYRAWSAGVSNFFWFSLIDFPPEPNLPFSETLQSGLYFWAPTVAQEQPKEVLYAFRFPLVAFHRKDGLFFWGRTPSSGRGKVAIQIEKGGHWRNAFVAHADSHGMFTGVLRTQYGRNKRGAVRARYLHETSLPFPIRRVGDFPHPPFG